MPLPAALATPAVGGAFKFGIEALSGLFLASEASDASLGTLRRGQQERAVRANVANQRISLHEETLRQKTLLDQLSSRQNFLSKQAEGVAESILGSANDLALIQLLEGRQDQLSRAAVRPRMTPVTMAATIHALSRGGGT